ncbi:VOC family protein [Acuticoccus kandeliae]|uniref:VOC family protein n=1 Tax=Acuticoccus kandeliae TaxID=2073160 RepID=UPI000D3E41D3|nr:VOC family protein [Acuticoccus kandeliae]
MARMIFVNLPVGDLGKATAFYEAIGFTKDDRFSDETASGMVLTDIIHVMLLTHEKFASFTPKTVVDAKTSTEVLLCLSTDSREEVDALIATAEAAGGVADPGPVQDYGFMYGRSFEDPDGHIWEIMWMNVEAFLAEMPQNNSAA